MTGTTNYEIEGEETAESNMVFWSTYNSTLSEPAPRCGHGVITHKPRENVTSLGERRETVQHR